MSRVTLYCKLCGKRFEIAVGEHNRQAKRGRAHFFCSLSCSARYGNRKRKKRVVRKECPICKTTFKSDSGAKSATYCCRSCASKGSVTQRRREKARLVGLRNARLHLGVDSIASSLRSREMWKYEKILNFLSSIRERFEVEYVLDRYIYDLALIDRKMLVEFDSDYHDWEKQKRRDCIKDKIASQNGWSVVRIAVGANDVIEQETLLFIVNRCPLIRIPCV